MWSALNSIGGLISRNKTKIALASVIAIAVTVYINYDSSDSEVEKQKTIKLLEEPSQSRPGTRSRLLLRIRTQFDFACRQFLPTLKTKVCEAVDINGTVSRIKKLRENSSSNTKEIESKLWNEIKTASFTILIVTAYAMSAVCTLLKLQLHLLARLIRQQGCEFQGTRIALNEIDFKLDDEMFHTLIQRTYQHFFERGLKEFIEQVKQQITVDLVGWNVKDKLHVSYDELIYAFKNIRINLERNIGPIVKTIFIPPESIEQTKVSGEGCAIQHIIDQTWDLCECPNFQSVVYMEAVDKCFEIIYQILQNDSYNEQNNTNHIVTSPPLASLLPQIKAISAKLLPTDIDYDGFINSEVRDVSSGPYLDSFCISAFDA